MSLHARQAIGRTLGNNFKAKAMSARPDQEVIQSLML